MFLFFGRFNSSSSPSPGLPPSLSSIHGNRDNQDNRDSRESSNRHSNRENSTSGGNSGNNNTPSSSGNRDHDRERSGHNNCPSNGIPGNNPSDSSPADFNPTAAYLWLLSQQQQQSAAAAAALNLTGRIPGQGHVPSMTSHPGHGSLNGLNNGMASPEKQRSSVGGERSGSRDTVSSGNKEHVSNTSSGQHDRNVSSNNNIMSSKHDVDESTDDEDDDIESHNSSRSENPVSSTGFNGKFVLSRQMSPFSSVVCHGRSYDAWVKRRET